MLSENEDIRVRLHSFVFAKSFIKFSDAILVRSNMISVEFADQWYSTKDKSKTHIAVIFCIVK